MLFVKIKQQKGKRMSAKPSLLCPRRLDFSSHDSGYWITQYGINRLVSCYFDYDYGDVVYSWKSDKLGGNSHNSLMIKLHYKTLNRWMEMDFCMNL